MRTAWVLPVAFLASVGVPLTVLFWSQDLLCPTCKIRPSTLVIDEAFVTASNEEYSSMIQTLVESVHLFSKRPIIVYGLNYVPRLNTTKWPRVINGGTLRSARHVHWNKLKVCVAVLARAQRVIWLDTDGVVTRRIDDLWEAYRPHSMETPYPIMTRHDNDPGDYFSYMARLGVSRTSQPYGHAASFAFSVACSNFFSDALAYAQTGRFSGANWDESLMNVLLWRANATKQFVWYTMYGHNFGRSDWFFRNDTNFGDECRIMQAQVGYAYLFLHNLKSEKAQRDVLDLLVGSNWTGHTYYDCMKRTAVPTWTQMTTGSIVVSPYFPVCKKDVGRTYWQNCEYVRSANASEGAFGTEFAQKAWSDFDYDFFGHSSDGSKILSWRSKYHIQARDSVDDFPADPPTPTQEELAAVERKIEDAVSTRVKQKLLHEGPPGLLEQLISMADINYMRRAKERAGFLSAGHWEAKGYRSANLGNKDQSDGGVRYLLLSALYPCFWTLEKEPSVVNLWDGGKWTCGLKEMGVAIKSSGRKCVVYSFGSQGNDAFEAHVADLTENGCETHVFDPTSKPLPRWNFHLWGLGSRDEKTSIGPVQRIDTTMAQLGHTEVDLLKFDVEGAEWAVLNETDWKKLRVGQIYFEMHGFSQPSFEYVVQLYERLEDAGYRIFSSEPVCGGCVGQMEVSWIHKDWRPDGWKK